MLSCGAHDSPKLLESLRRADIDFEPISDQRMTTAEVVTAVLIAVPSSIVTVLTERLIERILPRGMPVKILVDGAEVPKEPNIDPP